MKIPEIKRSGGRTFVWKIAHGGATTEGSECSQQASKRTIPCFLSTLNSQSDPGPEEHGLGIGKQLLHSGRGGDLLGQAGEEQPALADGDQGDQAQAVTPALQRVRT